MEIVNIDLVSFYELCYTNSTLDNLSDFEKIMGLLGCKTKEEDKLFEHEKGIIEKIMKKAEKFRDDSEMIEEVKYYLKSISSSNYSFENAEEIYGKERENVGCGDCSSGTSKFIFQCNVGCTIWYMH